ncbi:MAG: VWA domain-containing protein [Gammaproteobacteria bacterium]|nr:VWA domain-containing protein [Gammaproteobacteria bacterium]
MLEFAHPLALLAIPLPLLAWWLLPPQRERVSALRVPFFAQIAAAAGSEARAGAVILRRRWLQLLVATLVWLLLVAGLAKPEWVGEPIVRTEAARDIMLALDLSGSMDYYDFPGEDGTDISRFEAVQRVVDQFVAERESDRIGLVVFGTKAYLQLPFTRDLETARALVDLMEVGMAGPKTALGDSIGLAINSFEASEIDDRLLILLTDGNDTASKMTPINAADIAALNGIEIHTIGIGDTDATGEDRVDFDVLAAIASRTGGEFHNAEDEAALDAVYRRIDQTAAAEVRTQSWRPRESLVHWPAGLAVILVLFAYAALILGSRRRGSRA